MKKPAFLQNAAAPAADVQQNRARALKNGAYASALTVAVLAALILLNLVVRALPTQYTGLDISTGGMFTLSETTKGLLQGLDRDVTAYYLGETGNEDVNITRILERYAGQGSRFRWQQRDPNLYPTFAQQYGIQDASVDSVILVCGEKAELVDFYDMYEVDYSSYYTTGSYTYSFSAENALTTSLSRVIRTEVSLLYQLTGHGETALDQDLVTTLENSGMQVEQLSLVSAGEIPQDAAVLLINAPRADLTKTEAETLRAYLDAGGRVLVSTDLRVDTPQLDDVLAAYGLSRQPGLLIETDMNYYAYNYPPNYLLPEVCQNDVTQGMTQGMYVFAPIAQGIRSEEGDTLTCTTLLQTSASSYAMQDYANADRARQGEDDPNGPFAVAMASESSQTGGRVVWVGCADLFTGDTDQLVAGGNSQFLGSVVNWLSGQEAAAVIDAKSMSGAMLSVPATVAVALGVLIVLILPLGCLVGGAVYCVLRRRR